MAVAAGRTGRTDDGTPITSRTVGRSSRHAPSRDVRRPDEMREALLGIAREPGSAGAWVEAVMALAWCGGAADDIATFRSDRHLKMVTGLPPDGAPRLLVRLDGWAREDAVALPMSLLGPLEALSDLDLAGRADLHRALGRLGREVNVRLGRDPGAPGGVCWHAIRGWAKEAAQAEMLAEPGREGLPAASAARGTRRNVFSVTGLLRYLTPMSLELADEGDARLWVTYPAARTILAALPEGPALTEASVEVLAECGRRLAALIEPVPVVEIVELPAREGR